jgi:hypothetical protein
MKRAEAGDRISDSREKLPKGQQNSVGRSGLRVARKALKSLNIPDQRKLPG